MNVPKLRFKEFDGEWENKTLSEVVKVLDGDRGKNYPSGNDFMDQGHTLFLNATNVTKNGFSFVNRQYISQIKSDSLGNGKLEENDIVLTSRGSLGHVAWYSYNVKKKIPHARINSGMLILRSNNKVSPIYISQYLVSPLGKRRIKLISFGSAQPQLTKKDIQNYKIFMPEIIEQEKIGLFFQKIDKKIQLQQQKIDLLQEQKKGFLQKMFPKADETQPEMRFGGFTGDWEQHKLGDIAKVIDPHPSHRAPEATKQGVPFIGIGDVDELGNINYNSARIVDEKIYEEHRGRYDLSIPSIGIGRVASLGKVIRLRNDTGKYTISPTLSIIQFDSQNNLDFLYFCMNTDVFQKQFKSFSNGSTRQSVGIQDLRTLQINLPTEQNEQENISEFLSELQKKIQFELKKLETLKIQKQGFMQQMFI